jgi:hypothetical protein
MFARERWEHDDASAVATVVGRELVCSECNAVLHIGHLPPQHRASALAHLARVNGVTVGNARRICTTEFATW